MSETTGAAAARRDAADGDGWPAVATGRKIANLGYRIACWVALALVVGPALWLVGGVLAHAIPNWQWSVLTTNTAGETGGLKQAILGTLLITLGVLIIGGTISILAGLYLAEYATGRPRTILRSGYEILSGIPSVVLGIPQGWTLWKIVFKSALPGIVTGLLVAIAISVGETAPLLYTAGWSDFTPTFQLTGQPIAFLTYPVFSFFNLPDAGAKTLSYDAGLLLLVFVLLVIIAGRAIVAWSRRHAE